MDIQWKKAEGEIPMSLGEEFLAVGEHGSTLIGFLHKEKDGSWTCSVPTHGEYNETMGHVRWYIDMDVLLATVPK